MRKYVQLWTEKAKDKAVDTEVYEAALADHRWLLIEPPNWGFDFEPRTAVDSDLYCQKRVRARESLRKYKSWSWESLSVAIVKPYIVQFSYDGNHLTREAQSLYLEGMGRAMAAMLCTHCRTPIGTYIWPHHRDLKHHDL